jgi:nicotinamidase/pyrazinamidase
MPSASPSAALLVIDVQEDFCPGGALAVSRGDRVVPVVNGYIAQAVAHDMPVYASRDWHPAVSSHFQTCGGPWPPHCVQDTPGARFHPDLALPPTAIIVTKGDDPSREGYSAFDGRTPEGTALVVDLRARGIGRLYVGGLATDYCVKHSVLDGLRAGFDVRVLNDAIAGVDLRPGDSAAALREMRDAGARIAQTLTPADDPIGKETQDESSNG